MSCTGPRTPMSPEAARTALALEREKRSAQPSEIAQKIAEAKVLYLESLNAGRKGIEIGEKPRRERAPKRERAPRRTPAIIKNQHGSFERRPKGRHQVPPMPLQADGGCGNCGRQPKGHSHVRGRCDACYRYFRTYGIDRHVPGQEAGAA